MSFHLTNSQIETLAALLVWPPWIWLAIRTKQFLQAITRRSIPLSSRTIWLVKIVAIIFSAGSAPGLLVDVGIPWFVAIIPAGIIIVLSLQENVSQVIPVKPVYDASAYEAAWLEYRRLRAAYRFSILVCIFVFFLAVLLGQFVNGLPRYALVSASIAFLAAIGASLGYMGFSQVQWLFWPCPRCGCSFRGIWARLWLPKTCAYCGLPRKEQPIDQDL